MNILKRQERECRRAAQIVAKNMLRNKPTPAPVDLDSPELPWFFRQPIISVQAKTYRHQYNTGGEDHRTVVEKHVYRNAICVYLAAFPLAWRPDQPQSYWSTQHSAAINHPSFCSFFCSCTRLLEESYESLGFVRAQQIYIVHVTLLPWNRIYLSQLSGLCGLLFGKK